MTQRTDPFYDSYERFTDDVLASIRRETFDRDFGQNSWLTAEEFDRFLERLRIGREHHVLEVASGSGGPALYMAERIGCRVTGIDVNQGGITEATRTAAKSSSARLLQFQVADANAALPFEADSFDAIVCIDAINHFQDRLHVLREWRRVLRPGGRAVFTDPVVLTGPVTNTEIAERSSIGSFLFVPPGVNERLAEDAGLRVVETEDVSANAALVARRWREARGRREVELTRIEGAEQFVATQRFLASVQRLTAERRLSRIAYGV